MKLALPLTIASSLAFGGFARADIYLHYPPGGNDSIKGALATQFQSSAFSPSEASSRILEKRHHNWTDVTVKIVGGSRSITPESLASIEQAYRSNKPFTLPFTEVQVGPGGVRKVLYRWIFVGAVIDSLQKTTDGSDPAIIFKFKFKSVTWTNASTKEQVTDAWGNG